MKFVFKKSKDNNDNNRYGHFLRKYNQINPAHYTDGFFLISCQSFLESI